MGVASYAEIPSFALLLLKLSANLPCGAENLDPLTHTPYLLLMLSALPTENKDHRTPKTKSRDKE